MEQNLSSYRKSYEQGTLEEEQLPDTPLDLFQQWFNEAEASDTVSEVNAMTVATIGEDGFPKSRVVLLKAYSQEGFIFYTNYESEKGKAINRNPHVCLSFFWDKLERQVIIKGIARKTPTKTSQAYFDVRPRGSQIGAWTSPQSEIISSRKVLKENEKQIEKQYKDEVIPKPPHWGGFIVEPMSIEFWQGRANRLHDRIRFTLNDNKSWTKDRLAP